MSPTAPTGVPSPKPGESLVKNATREVGQWLSDNVGQRVSGVAIGLYRGLQEAWGDTPTAEQKNILRASVEFFRDAPRSFIDVLDGLENSNPETMASLTTHRHWIEAFRDPNIFTEPTHPKAAQDVLLSPKDFLLQLDIDRRKSLYFDYVDTYIPEKIRDAHAAVFGAPAVAGASSVDRADTIIAGGKINDVQDALSLIIGEDPRAVLSAVTVRPIAEESLRTHYFDDAQTLTEAERKARRLDPDDDRFDSVRGPMLEDFTRMMRYHPGVQASEITDPTSFRRLGDRLPGSRMKGAIRIELLEKVDGLLPTLAERERQIRVEHAEFGGRTSHDFYESDRTERAQEARTVRDMWRRMSGIEKLVLIVGVLYAAKKMPGAAVALGAAYFGQKLFMGADRPFDIWGKKTQDVLKKMPLIGNDSPMESAAQRGDIMTQFLDEVAREELNQSGRGFAQLAKIPMNKLATFFSLKPGAIRGKLQHQELFDDLPKDLRKSLSGYEEFFANSGSLEEVEDALPHVFYMVGAEQNPSEARLVEDARLNRTGSLRYDDIDSVDNPNPVARETYEKLAQEGKARALDMDMTLMKFIRRAMYSDTRKEPAPAPRSPTGPTGAPIPGGPAAAPAPGVPGGPAAAPAAPGGPAPGAAPPVGPAGAPAVAPPAGPAPGAVPPVGPAPGAAPPVGPAPGAVPPVGPAAGPAVAPPAGPAAGPAPIGAAPGAAPPLGPAAGVVPPVGPAPAAAGAPPAGPAVAPAAPAGPAPAPAGAPVGPAAAPAAAPPNGPAPNINNAPAGPAPGVNAAPAGPAPAPNVNPLGPAAGAGQAPRGPAAGAAPRGPAQ